MESKKLSARVLAYRDAIQQARDAGVAWSQLAELFDAKNTGYFSDVCRAMSKSKYKPCEQLPLPEPIKQAKRIDQRKHDQDSTQKTVVNSNNEPQNQNRRPLPGEIPAGDDEIAKALEKKGIVFK